MNKSTTLSLLLLLLLLLPAQAAFSASQSSQPAYRFAMAGSYPLKHPVAEQVILPWIEDIQSASKGRILITYYPPETLLPQSAYLDAVRKNDAAMAHQNNSLSRSALPISSVLFVPSALKNSPSASSSFWRLYRNLPELQKEYANIKLLALHTTPPLQLFSTFAAHKPEDMTGKKILCASNDAAMLLRALNAEPVILPEQSWLQEFDARSADGAVTTFDAFASHNLERLPITHVLQFDLSVSPCWIGMNSSEWDSLPRELKQIIDSRSGEKISLKIAQVLDETCQNQRNKMILKEISVKNLNGDNKEEWRLNVEPVAKSAWLEQMKSRKIGDGEKILERARRYYSASENSFTGAN